MLQSWGLWMLLLACNLFKITLILRKHSAANQYRYYLKEGLIRIEFLHLVLMSPRAAWTLSIFTGSVSTSWYKLMCIVVFSQIAGWPDYLHIIVLSLFPDLLFSLFTFPTWLAVTGHVGSDDSNLNKVQRLLLRIIENFPNLYVESKALNERHPSYVKPVVTKSMWRLPSCSSWAQTQIEPIITNYWAWIH